VELRAAHTKWAEEKKQLHSSIWATLQQLAEHKAEIQKSPLSRHTAPRSKGIQAAGEAALDEVISQSTEGEDPMQQ
jgi:hypothetical protein